MFSATANDLRYSLRALLARPGFSAVAVLTLALGIGANTAIFSVMHGLFLAPLPYAHGERLVDVYNTYPTSSLQYAGTSIPDYLDRREQAQSLEDLALYTGANLNLAEDGQPPERLVGLRATPSLFSTLSSGAALGRVFDERHAEPGQDKVAVISHALWRNRFNADPGVIGRSLRLSGETYQVIGVMPEDFGFPSRETQLWVPFAFTPEQRGDFERGNEYSQSIGRLRKGATIAQLDAELDAIVARNAERIAGIGGLDPAMAEQAARFAEFLRGGNFTGRAQSLRELQVGETRPLVLILQGAVALVLLIAAANVANLLLARMVSRQKELSVRNALGASRGRIARQLLSESLIVALAGGAAGLLLALGLIELLPRLGLDAAVGRYPITLDLPVLGFALAVSIATGLLAALVPVVSLFRSDLARQINDAGRIGGGGRVAGASRNLLVVAQMALATALLVGAGLLLRSFVSLQQESPGFEPGGTLTAQLALPGNRFPDTASRARLLDEVLREARALPGIEHAAWTSSLPFANSNSQGSYSIDGLEVADASASPHANQRQISDDFFASLRIPLLQGRTFTPGDHGEAEPVVVIDQLLAEKYFKDQPAIGQRIRRGRDAPWATVVGVVGTVKHGSLRDTPGKETIYWPHRQNLGGFGALVLRGPNALAPDTADALRTALGRVDAELPLFNVLSMQQRIALSLDTQRAPMNLVGGFAGVALLLSAIGIYAVLAFSVSQRTGELGVRMAIGAGRREILGLVLGHGARLVAIGLGIGVGLALMLGQLAKAQLFGVAPWDPLTFVAVPPLLAAIALLACWLPARRAARIDPLVALRYE
ncbi:ABC transporter permease [Pseudomarimonas salicorniae]|uniref:ABC transporter permease n=1 Tax=Pseudomarimonas salicorniae TaxID=2933270 RepID=A0ABT0GG79_9GAMM|nr:ABC transporter permease [Lysobacter sp. CAU 1642]MCK7593536.1 ABC transporter permease [Lysobacter sp. CAU 1642]